MAAAPVKLRTDTAQVVIGVLLCGGSILLADAAGNPYWTHNFQLLTVLATVAFFQNFLLCDAGQASFGQGAVFGASAYAGAILCGMHGVPYWLAAIGGVGAAMLFGLMFAMPALRVQGYYLGFVTFGAALVFPDLIVALDDYTHGVNGIPLAFDAINTRGALGISPLSVIIVVVAGLSLALLAWLRRTGFGRAMQVAAISPEAALSLGISPGRMRCGAFLICAAGTGVAGALYAPVVGFVGPSAFNVELSILFFFAVIVGGRGQPLGPIAGIVVIYLLPNMLLAEVISFRLLLYGGIALVVMLALPDGLVGSFERWRRRRAMQPEPLDLRIEAVVRDGGEGGRARDGVVIAMQGGCKLFGRVAALDEVDITVRSGEIHGLIGANGSGKTSLLNVLSGLSRLDRGTLRINGVATQRLPAWRIARLGIGRTFQTPRVFEALSTWENLVIGLDAAGAGRAAVQPEALRLLEHRLADYPVGAVTHGQRRLLEVLRVVLKGADLLLLDEPAAGLSARERGEFSALLLRLRDRFGKTIVLVEHDLDLVTSIADRLTVLDAGRVVASGTAAEVVRDPAVRSLFVGSVHA